MTWTLNDIRIYVQNKSEAEKQIIARLNPVGGATILHRWGQDDPIIRLEAYVLTSGDMMALHDLIDDTTSYELSGAEGSLGDWIVSSVESSRESSTWHKFFDRPALDTNTPLYVTVMELYSDN